MPREKVSMSQLESELVDFDIEKIKPFFADRGINIPDHVKTKEELDYWLKVVYGRE